MKLLIRCESATAKYKSILFYFSNEPEYETYHNYMG